MTKIVGATRTWSFISAALLTCFGVCTVKLALAQNTPAPGTTAAPGSSAVTSAQAGPADGASQPSASVDVAAELARLRAEVDALKTKQDAQAAAPPSQNADSDERVAAPELLRVYGFMDFGIDKFFLSKGDGLASLRPTKTTTFVFGNLNLYFEAQPVEHLRTMVELRFTLAPNGEEIQLGPPIGSSYKRTDTSTFDYSSPSSQSVLRLGSLYIERAWSEYQFSDLFKVQWGLYLNPFGIWNLDHGSPTLISLMLPTFIAAQMVPTRLLGVHVHGSAFSGSSELGYALHVSNGRGPLDFDLSERKALGARVYYAREGDFGRLVLGASGYWGTYLDQQKVVVPTSTVTADFSWVGTVKYTEEVLGLDVALDLGSLRVRSEAAFRWVKYEDGKFERVATGDGSEQYLSNRLEYSAYIIAAYRTPWRIEPYVEGEVASKSFLAPVWLGSGRASPALTVLYFSAGFNIELTTHTLLKTQFVLENALFTHVNQNSSSVPIVFIRAVDSF